MSRRDTRTPEEIELDDRIARAQEIEARLDETLTRREVIDAIDTVAGEYGCGGTHESELIADAFRKLAKALS